MAEFNVLKERSVRAEQAESLGEIDDAIEIYSSILRNDETGDLDRYIHGHPIVYLASAKLLILDQEGDAVERQRHEWETQLRGFARAHDLNDESDSHLVPFAEERLIENDELTS